MFNIDEFSHKMQQSLDVFIRYTKEISVGAANPGLIENIKVEAYGSYMSLYELASITVSDPSTLIVSPFDKSLCSAIEKAIAFYNQHLSCANRNNHLYIVIPSLTEEIRKEFVRHLRDEANKTKEKIRSIRRQAINNAESTVKDANLSEDSKKVLIKDIEDMVHNFIKKTDEVLDKKEKEIMTI